MISAGDNSQPLRGILLYFAPALEGERSNESVPDDDYSSHYRSIHYRSPWPPTRTSVSSAPQSWSSSGGSSSRARQERLRWPPSSSHDPLAATRAPSGASFALWSTSCTQSFLLNCPTQRCSSSSFSSLLKLHSVSQQSQLVSVYPFIRLAQHPRTALALDEQR